MGRTVRVNKGSGGWGKGLTVEATDSRDKVVSVTGGGIHPVAAKIAELTGGQAIDGFNHSVPEGETMCVVIDCGGTARIGVYPMKGILTVDVLPSSPSGPLSKYIKEDNFVSGVGVKDVVIATEAESASTNAAGAGGQVPDHIANASPSAQVAYAGRSNWLLNMSRGIGRFIGILYQSGRDSIDMLIKNILPFMAFVSMLMGIIEYTGLGKLLANGLVPLASSLGGLIVVAIICTLPFLSPVLGPGAVIAQIIGVLVGTQIASKAINPAYALPALFAIDGQVGCDFVPVGLALGEAEPATIEYGVPAVLYSRLITGVVAVVIAYVASIGMY